MPASVAAARRIAYHVIRRTFEDEAFTDRAFRSAADRANLTGRDRAQAQRLAYGSVQRRGSSDHLIDRFTKGRSGRLDPPVSAALRLGLYELLFADGTPDHAAINEAVELARIGGAAKATGLVNAVLRRAVRERTAVTEMLNRRDSPAELAVAESLPEWLARKWWRELGAESARQLAAAANRPAERGLRINTSAWSVAAAVAAAEEAGVQLEHPEAGPPEMTVLRGSWAAIESWFNAGLATPQSRGSAVVVDLLDPQPGDQVLDLCAGPGTKTGQIAARLAGRGEVIAVEKNEGRAAETADQLRRLDVHLATVVEADAAEVTLGGPDYDRVLVDAPCSDLGALNSRPDARWRKSPRLIERMVELQERILLNAVRHLRPGGTLVYSTCTISTAENESQAEHLLRVAGRGEDGLPAIVADDLGAGHPELASTIDSRFLQIRPDRDRTTGFFIARFRRPPKACTVSSEDE